MFFVMIWS